MPLIQKPTIEVINKATLPLGIDLAETVRVANIVLDRDLAPEWGVSANVVIGDPATGPKPGNWAMFILDTAPEPGAEGYHDRTADGQPVGYVLVKPTTQAGDRLDVTFFHELFELLGNPNIDLWVEGPNNQMVINELCDAVEETWYFEGSVAVSNFQLRKWFDTMAKPGDKLDFMGKCQKPFELLAGGYITVLKEGRAKQLFGSRHAAEKFSNEDRRMRRTHRLMLARNRLAEVGHLLHAVHDGLHEIVERQWEAVQDATSRH